MSHIHGRTVSDREARGAVSHIGPLSRIWKPSATEKALYRLSEGVFIEFVYYEDGREALIVSKCLSTGSASTDYKSQAFRDQDKYRLEQLNALDQTPVRRSAANCSSVASQYLQRYDVDRRSVFVGNLPQGITRGDLKEIFCAHGDIIEVEVISRESIHEGAYLIFDMLKPL